MADTKITDLSSATAATGDELVINDVTDTSDKKVTVQGILDRSVWILGTSTRMFLTLGRLINTLLSSLNDKYLSLAEAISFDWIWICDMLYPGIWNGPSLISILARGLMRNCAFDSEVAVTLSFEVIAARVGSCGLSPICCSARERAPTALDVPPPPPPPTATAGVSKILVSNIPLSKIAIIPRLA